MENDISVIGATISGPGRSNSLLTEGTHYLNLLSADGNGQSGNLSYQFTMGGALTDDKYYDVRRVSLTEFNFNGVTGGHAFDVGDIHAFLSPYTLSSPLKGFSYRYLNNDSPPWFPEITLICGKATPRWDTLWGETENFAMNRDVYGGRFQFNLISPLKFGFDILESQDQTPDYRINRYDSRIYALDFRYRPLRGLTMAGESAFNNTRTLDEADSPRVDGSALAFKTTGERDPFRILMEYERVTPGFKNPLDSAVPDREKAKFSCQYNFDKSIHLYTNLLWYQDDLDSRKPWGQTDTYVSETALGYTRPFNRTEGFVKLSYIKEIAERETVKIKHNDIVNLNYQDRISIIETDTNIGFNLYDHNHPHFLNDDGVMFNTRLHSRFGADSIRFNPSLFVGVWTMDDELSGLDDRAYQYSVGIGIDLPVQCITTNLSAGVNQFDKEYGFDSTRSFCKIYIDWQPDLLDRVKQTMFYFSGALNDFDFSASNENFQEETITAGIKIKY